MKHLIGRKPVEDLYSFCKIVYDLFRLNVIITVTFRLESAHTSAMLGPLMHPQGFIAVDTLPVALHVLEQIELSEVLQYISNVGVGRVASMAAST